MMWEKDWEEKVGNRGAPESKRAQQTHIPYTTENFFPQSFDEQIKYSFS